MNQIRHFICLFSIILGISACSHIPQENKYDLYTQAAQTISVNLTETAAAMPPTPTTTTTPTNTPTVLPTNPIILIPTAISNTEVTPTSNIINPYQVEFLSVEPYPNQFTPGQKFRLTWQLKNIGTATWSGKYKFAYHKGIQLADQSIYEINQIVQPGQTLIITMPSTAPAEYGTYQTEWSFSNPEGITFYYVYYTVVVGDQTFITSEPTLVPSETPSL